MVCAWHMAFLSIKSIICNVWIILFHMNITQYCEDYSELK